eukprot:PhM_4_TR9506/c0_g1_i1/m.41864
MGNSCCSPDLVVSGDNAPQPYQQKATSKNGDNDNNEKGIPLVESRTVLLMDSDDSPLYPPLLPLNVDDNAELSLEATPISLSHSALAHVVTHEMCHYLQTHPHENMSDFIFRGVWCVAERLRVNPKHKTTATAASTVASHSTAPRSSESEKVVFIRSWLDGLLFHPQSERESGTCSSRSESMTSEEEGEEGQNEKRLRPRRSTPSSLNNGSNSHNALSAVFSDFSIDVDQHAIRDGGGGSHSQLELSEANINLHNFVNRRL